MDQKHAKGEQVLYKEPSNGRWVGPGRVIRMEGNKVRIIHEGYDKLIPTVNMMSFTEENKEMNSKTIKKEEHRKEKNKTEKVETKKGSKEEECVKENKRKQEKRKREKGKIQDQG